MEHNNESHPIEQIMKSAMGKLKTVIDVNTVVGSPIDTEDGSTIIPISKVTVGFVAGGGEYASNYHHSKSNDKNYPFAGGSGSGFNIMPVGFLIKENGMYKMINVDSDNTAATLIDLAGKIASAITGRIDNNVNNEEMEDE